MTDNNAILISLKTTKEEEIVVETPQTHLGYLPPAQLVRHHEHPLGPREAGPHVGRHGRMALHPAGTEPPTGRPYSLAPTSNRSTLTR